MYCAGILIVALLFLVLRFVGPADSINSCSFVQMMEQRLENAYEEAQDKVLESYSGLSVEIQSTSQAIGSPAVSLVYVVKNQDVILNGTVSSGLLNQLTAELVGYFLFFPPLVIAERKCPTASWEGLNSNVS
uniref:KIAA1549-like b n=1 Tax=Salmo trutta TaxID=8032 RepID=A0A673YM43_SALTR